MSHRIVKLGYCRDCGKNVAHVHRFLTAIGKTWGRLVGNRLARMGLGHWHCPICTHECYWLPRPRDDVGELRTEDERQVEWERVGNHFHDHVSLVARQERMRRFSPKFRESVVSRLLTGATTLVQTRQELGLSDSDLLAWIAEQVERQAVRINDLESQVNRLCTALRRHGLAAHDIDTLLESDGSVVEGVARRYDRPQAS